jgi:poly(A) polymerase
MKRMDEKRQAAESIVQELRAAGFQAYFVGGCVRDLVMGRLPKDYDVATDAIPDEVLYLFPGSLAVGAKFGVVMALREAGNVEIATFRSDGKYADGRHPDAVQFARTAREDVQRRDFTINGLLYDPAQATVLDYVGGQQDIAAGVVRTIGAARERFGEDHLRMLRAVRFAARFGFRLDGDTAAAIREQAQRIREVSRERTRDEILKILTEGDARRGFELLDETRLLEVVLPEIKAMQGVEQPPEYHPEGDVWKHTLQMLGLLRNPTPTLALGVLLHDVGKPPTFAVKERIRFDGHVEVGMEMAREICVNLRLPLRDTERVVELVQHHMRFADFPRMRRSTQLRFVRMKGFEEHLQLHRIDCLGSHGDLTIYEQVKKMWEGTPPHEVHPPAVLNGDDLLAQGYSPGPIFREILKAVEDEQLEGKIHNRQEALGFVMRQFPLAPS